MSEIAVPRAPGVSSIQAYLAGAASAPGVANPIRLASNEAATGPSPMVVEAIRSAAGGVDRYPDPGSARLRAAISERYGLDPDNIVCGPGSEALIHFIMRGYASVGDEVIVPSRAFVLGSIAAASCGALVVPVPEGADFVPDVDTIAAAVTERTRVVYLPNVNNPTGALLPFTEVERLRGLLRSDILLLLDAAYRDYVDDPAYAAGDVLTGGATGNVVVTGTFSKSYALGGLRLGWLHASRDIVATVNLVRPAFGVGLVTQAAGLAALADRAHLAAELASVRSERSRFVEELATRGIGVRHAHANFVLAELPADAADASAANQFLTRHGVLVRPAINYGLTDALRITIGRREELQTVLDTLDAWLAETRR